MYCRTCSKELDDQAVVCPGCGVPPKKGKKYCPNCGQPTDETTETCASCGVTLTGTNAEGNCCGCALLGVGVIICAILVTTCGPLLFGIVPISGIVWALIRAANKKQ